MGGVTEEAPPQEEGEDGEQGTQEEEGQEPELMEPPSPNGVPDPPSSGPPLPKDVDKSRSQSSAAQDYLNLDVTPNALVR